jgi:hypothetical protein
MVLAVRSCCPLVLAALAVPFRLQPVLAAHQVVPSPSLAGLAPLAAVQLTLRRPRHLLVPAALSLLLRVLPWAVTLVRSSFRLVRHLAVAGRSHSPLARVALVMVALLPFLPALRQLPTVRAVMHAWRAVPARLAVLLSCAVVPAPPVPLVRSKLLLARAPVLVLMP